MTRRLVTAALGLQRLILWIFFVEQYLRTQRDPFFALALFLFFSVRHPSTSAHGANWCAATLLCARRPKEQEKARWVKLIRAGRVPLLATACDSSAGLPWLGSCLALVNRKP
jgi:hypothetical protein